MYALANAFSLNMLPLESGKTQIREIEQEDAICILNSSQFKSYVGHKDTAEILSLMLGIQVLPNRESFEFNIGTKKMLVAQYSGNRLPEGATQLPEGARFRWFEVSFDFEIYDVAGDIETYMKELPFSLQETLEALGIYGEVKNQYIVKCSNHTYYRVSYSYSQNVLTTNHIQL